MILALIKSRAEKWFNRLVHQAIIDGITLSLYRAEIKVKSDYLRYRYRKTRTLSDQAQLNIGRAYVILTSAVAISAGIMGWTAAGFAVWAFGLVMPLVWLIILRRRMGG